MSVLNIFSYLPNPRVWKTTITARIADLEVDIVGAKPAELANWLWDAQPRPLSEAERTDSSPHARQGRRGFQSTLYKTDAFLRTQPFGTVPAAFSPDGNTGIFESNSILRAVARQADPALGLYGYDSYSASRIDSFLDANLVFAREAQVYLLALQSKELSAETYQRMHDAFDFYLAGIDSAVTNRRYLLDDVLTIADISFACDFTQFQRELFFTPQLQQQGLKPISVGMAHHLHPSFEASGANPYPAVSEYLARLLEIPALREDLQPYVTDLKEKLNHRLTT